MYQIETLNISEIFKEQTKYTKTYHRIGPPGRFGLIVELSVCLSVCVCVVPSSVFFSVDVARIFV
jgi:hypothetical protein